MVIVHSLIITISERVLIATLMKHVCETRLWSRIDLTGRSDPRVQAQKHPSRKLTLQWPVSTASLSSALCQWRCLPSCGQTDWHFWRFAKDSGTSLMHLFRSHETIGATLFTFVFTLMNQQLSLCKLALSKICNCRHWFDVHRSSCLLPSFFLMEIEKRRRECPGLQILDIKS